MARSDRACRAPSVGGERLPRYRTTFVGRGRELEAIASLVSTHRLTTLVGPGGVGKTRLAAELAHRRADGEVGNVWWVDLSGPRGIAVDQIVAEALGATIEPVAGPLASVIAAVGKLEALLIVDNCEHLLDEAAGTIDGLLDGCPNLRVLATSREPLRLADECAWPVPILDMYDARTLFRERAALVSHQAVSDEAALARLCSRLDGIPLAIELAAAWSAQMTTAQIEEGLDDRFALLVRGPRGVLARHQTLLASIEWSHQLLDDTERTVLRRLGVFLADFDMEGAIGVCADEDVGPDPVATTLRELVDKSMVMVSVEAGEARFHLLETVRAFARRNLHEAGELDRCRDRHLNHYLEVIQEWNAEALTADKDLWRRRVAAEHENFRQALDWAMAGPDPEPGRRLAARLGWWWHLTTYGDEGMSILRAAIDRQPEDRSPLQAELLTALALVADTTSPVGIEYDVAQRALAIADEHDEPALRGLPLLLSAVGLIYHDFDRAVALSVEAGEAGALAGDEFVIDGSVALQGIIHHLRNEHVTSRALLERALEGLIRRNDRGVAATATSAIAVGLAATGDITGGLARAHEAVEIAEPLSDYHRVGAARSALALIQAQSGDTDSAMAVIEPIIRTIRGHDRPVFVPGVGRTMATIHLRRDQPGIALAWLDRDPAPAERALTYLDAEAGPLRLRALRLLGRANEAPGLLDAYRTAEVGRAMPGAQADLLAEVAWLQEGIDFAGAVDLHHQSLALRADHGLSCAVVDSIDAFVHLAVVTGDFDDAARLQFSADTARDVLGYVREPWQQRQHDVDLDAVRRALGESNFAARRVDDSSMSLGDAARYLRRGRGTRRRPSTGWASLTPTEREVVGLVVEGLTNPSIASRLHMSRSTVKTHLSHIYAKVGVSNRTELAATAPPSLRPA